MIQIAWILIACTFAILIAEFIYFRNQHAECQKYPFFKLRDDIISEITKSEKPDEILKTYDLVNGAIHRLNTFNFRFFADVMASSIHKMLEEGYKYNFDFSKKPSAKKIDLHPLDKRFLDLILDTAKKNSILLRLSMTRLGGRLLITATIPVGFSRFMKNHPELFKRKVDTMRDYAVTRSILNEAHVAHC